MTECQVLSSTEVIVTFKTTKTKPIKQKHDFLQCESIEDAVTEIINRTNPHIIGFGETHPQKDDGTATTPMKLFAEKILPVLSKSGYKELVLEGFHSDRETDLNLKAFLEGKIPFQTLEDMDIFPPNSINRFGQKAIMEKAKELSVAVYGGSTRLNDKETPFIFDSFLFLNANNRLAALMKRITQRTTEKALKLLRSGKTKVITYNGGQHNDIINVSTEKGISFGEYFKKKTRYKYVEVDLLSPELMEKGPHDKDYSYPEYEYWLKNAVPEKGVTLIKRGDSSFTIVLPAGIFPPLNQ